MEGQQLGYRWAPGVLRPQFSLMLGRCLWYFLKCGGSSAFAALCVSVTWVSSFLSNRLNVSFLVSSALSLDFCSCVLVLNVSIHKGVPGPQDLEESRKAPSAQHATLGPATLVGLPVE